MLDVIPLENFIIGYMLLLCCRLCLFGVMVCIVFLYSVIMGDYFVLHLIASLSIGIIFEYY